jgi:signal transduction histidine kinase
MAALGKLVAGIAHEFNTPLGVITSNTDTAGRTLARMQSDSPATGEDDTIRRAIESLRLNHDTIGQAANRLARIVDSLKRFTRLDEAHFELADVHEGIEATLELLTPQWGDRIEVVRQFGDLPKIQSYPTELNQAFMTLLMNAGEAIEDRGTVTITTSRHNGFVSIETTDTGRGIPPERLDSIFDIGFAQKGSRIRIHVGLANVKATVDRHHGDIGVESALGKGTTFAIRLPVRQGR